MHARHPPTPHHSHRLLLICLLFRALRLSACLALGLRQGLRPKRSELRAEGSELGTLQLPHRKAL
jgi:hypothetical protein